jgi:bacillithiol synthase
MTDAAAPAGRQPQPIGLDLAGFPWHRPLTLACLRDFPSVAPLFAGNPRDPHAWRGSIARVQASTRDHAVISQLLTTQLTRRGAHPIAVEAAQSLADRQTVAVVTGQQAGLFGGPLYTVLKAVTTIQLARQVERDHHVRAVPVFWIEADDHDWEEIRVSHVLNADHHLQDIVATDVPGAGKQSVGSLRFDDRIAETVSALLAALPASAFTEDLRAQLVRHYRPGAGVAQSFAGLLDGLFAAHGLVVFEAYAADVKPLASTVFVRELAHPGRTSKLAQDAARLMTSLGHAPQVEPADDSVALFYHGPDGREAIKHRDGAFHIGRISRPLDDLQNEAATHPERFSPNVLLRPIVQDFLLPTICYVAGPSELAYQAELGEVYRAFDVAAPLLMPRVSATLLDSAAARFLERHQLTVTDLHAEEDAALKRIIERSLPVGVDEAIDAMQRAIGDRAPSLRDAVSGVDATLGGAVDTTLEKMRDSLKSLHGKIIQATKRNDETLRRQFQRTYALVYPGGEPQERVLGIVFFLNRYGPEFITQLLSVLPLATDQHYVLTL